MQFGHRYCGRMKTCIIASIAVMALCAPAAAQTIPASKGPGPATGWHFYDDPEPLPEVELQEPVPDVASEQMVEDKNPVDATVSSAGPAPMSAEWLKANMPRLLNQALDNPSRENVEVYYAAQRVMMDKAERFTLAAEKVVVGNPMLDESIRRPLSTFGVHAIDQQAGTSKNDVLKSIAGKAGIWYFFASYCPYCKLQSPVLKLYAETYGFEILPVSTDGGPDPANSFEKYKLNVDQAQQLDISTTPTLLLYAPGKAPEIISIGLTSRTELEDRTILAAQKLGIISDYTAGTTKPVAPLGSPVDFTELEGVPIDHTAKIAEVLRQKLKGMNQ